MIYHDFKDKKLSALGLGCMRLPTLDGQYGNIDKEATAAMVAYAMEKGINYFDTAWGYHEKNSELVMGEILSGYPRDSYYIASKFPGFGPEYLEKKEEIFETQLRKCRVDYFDFYLFHCVSEDTIDGFLDPKYGVAEYLVEQKKAGRIRHLGFSAHAELPTLKRFLEAMKEHIDFVQIQLNWMDWELQDARGQVEMIRSYGLPVWVMEPVRGGRLADLPEVYGQRLKAVHPDWTDPQWAFRFLQSIEGVTMVLSGMSNMEQLQQNVETFQQARPLTQQEQDLLFQVAKEMNFSNTLKCTGCRYCTGKCPKELAIPELIKRYNKYIFSGKLDMTGASEQEAPQQCIGCQSCEEACPQNIKIADMMADMASKL